MGSCRCIPRINDSHPRLGVIAAIPRNHRKPVVNSRGGDDQVPLGESVPRLPAFLHQKPPFEHNVFSDLENTTVEDGAYVVREPVIQFRAARGFADQLNAKSNLGKRNRADIELVKGTAIDERHDPLVRLSPPQFRQDIATMPSERNVTYGHAAACWFQADVLVRRGLHRRNKVGARGSRCCI